MIGQAPLSPITNCPGWETLPEQEYLVQLAKTVPHDGVIVEIGGEWGMSASLFAFSTPDTVKIVTVDTFQGEMLDAHRKNLAEAGLAGRSQQIVGDSKIVVGSWEGDIDLLFIDGDHSYAGALADLQNWTPFVKRGGLVVLHDCAIDTNKSPHFLHFEVTRALTKWLESQGGAWENLKPVDTMTVLRRAEKSDSDPEPEVEEAPEIEEYKPFIASEEESPEVAPKPRGRPKKKGR